MIVHGISWKLYPKVSCWTFDDEDVGIMFLCE